MITTKELMSKVYLFEKNGKFDLYNEDFETKYASPDCGLEMGYYSLSKTDLFVGGIKRGRLLKNPKKPFSGFKYGFHEDRLMVAQRIIGDKVRSIIYLEYDGDYCFGYEFEAVTQAFERCFVYEMEGKKIKAFKILRGISSGADLLIENQQYSYSGDELISIRLSNVIFDSKKASERLRDESIYDHFNGKYWVPSSWALNDPVQASDDMNNGIDDQKKLCKKLEKKIKPDVSLDQAIDSFFEIVSEARPNDEEMLLYEVGCYSGSENSKDCLFCLVRQTPAPDEEYYQMHLEIRFDICDEVLSLSECKWHEHGDDDLHEYIMRSEAYKILKGRMIKKISVWVDET